MKKSTTIKKKLMTLTTVSMAGFALILTFAATAIMYNAVTVNVKNELIMLTSAYADHIEDSLDKAYSQLNMLARDPNIANNFGTLEKEDMRSWLNNDLRASYMFKSIVAANGEGFTYDGYDINSRPYYIKAMSGTPNLSDPTHSSKDDSLNYFSAQRMDNGVMDGIVIGEIDGSYFYNVLKSFEDTSEFGGYGFIVDSNGLLIADTDMTKVANGDNILTLAQTDSSYEDYAKLVNKMITDETSVGVYNLNDGQRYIIGYCPINTSEDWNIALVMPYNNTMSSTMMAIFVLIAVSVICLAGSAVFYLRFSKQISDSITASVDRVKLLSEGDLTSATPIVNTNDETKILCDSVGETIYCLNMYINDIKYVLSNLAAGDFTVESQIVYKGDFESIKVSLESIQSGMKKVFSDIVNCSQSVGASADQVSSSAQNLAEGAAKQAASIEELAATMGEISNQSQTTADRANSAKELTDKNEGNITNSLNCMEELKTAMNNINEKSTQISRIIKTIDDIAFQTNILALNAAVEAARAGEAGKGFAVVADEVRNLAVKSAAAASETQTLVGSAITSIQSGAELSEQMQAALNTVISANSEIAAMINSIANDSGSQMNGINQVNSGIDQISTVVQTNSATAEESAAASEELNGQAHLLSATVAVFKL